MQRHDTIAAIVRRLVDHFHPERIYLFGSAARGETTEDSDLDFLVVVPDDAPAAIVRGDRVHEILAGIPNPVDVIPWRRSDFDGRAAHVLASLPATVVREGKLLYDRRRVAA